MKRYNFKSWKWELCCNSHNENSLIPFTLPLGHSHTVWTTRHRIVRLWYSFNTQSNFIITCVFLCERVSVFNHEPCNTPLQKHNGLINQEERSHKTHVLPMLYAIFTYACVILYHNKICSLQSKFRGTLPTQFDRWINISIITTISWMHAELEMVWERLQQCDKLTYVLRTPLNGFTLAWVCRKCQLVKTITAQATLISVACNNIRCTICIERRTFPSMNLLWSVCVFGLNS